MSYIHVSAIIKGGQTEPCMAFSSDLFISELLPEVAVHSRGGSFPHSNPPRKFSLDYSCFKELQRVVILSGHYDFVSDENL